MTPPTMKRAITITLLACGLVPCLFAQEPAPTAASSSTSAFRLGVKLAPNFAWMRADSKDLSSDGSRMGYSFGLLGDFALGDQGTYFFSTGVLLNNIGGKFKADFTTDVDGVSTAFTSEQDLKLRYLEIPLTMKLRTKTDGQVNFYGQVGFSAAINLRARTDFTTTSTVGGSSTTVTSEDEDVIDDIAFFKASLVVGAGAELQMSSVTLVLGATFNNAFTNALDSDAKSFVSDTKKSKLFADYLEITAAMFF